MIDSIRGPQWYDTLNARSIDARGIVDDGIRKANVPYCHYAALKLLYRAICKRRDALLVELIIANKRYEPGKTSEEEVARGMKDFFAFFETFEVMGIVLFQVQADLAAMDRSWLRLGEGQYWYSRN